MKLLIFLLIIIFIYYQLNKYYLFEIFYHYYFAAFILISLLFYYMMNHQQLYMYKFMKNINDSHNKPLYDIESTSYKNNQIQGYKYNLAMKTGWRCMTCQNPILQKDINKHNINYIQPLQFGGQNNIDNLALQCPSCNNFKQI